jgi:HlyD family secretion protein
MGHSRFSDYSDTSPNGQGAASAVSVFAVPRLRFGLLACHMKVLGLSATGSGLPEPMLAPRQSGTGSEYRTRGTRTSRSYAALVSLVVVAAMALAVGCSQSPPETKAIAAAPAVGSSGVAVSVVRPQRTTLRLKLRQPGTVQAFEQTPIFAKISGYISEWKADIGDRVRKDQVLATLWVPEMEDEVRQKEALVEQAAAEVELAENAVPAAEAEYNRLKLQSARLSEAGRKGVLDKENVDEVRYNFEASEAKLRMARSNVNLKKARKKVAERNRDLAKTLLGYAKLTAPFDGVVTRRNINTSNFAQPPTGGKGEPLYVVERRDTMRVFVDVPETDAVWVNKETNADIHVQAIKGQDFSGQVARTSYSLDRTARTLVAEIDLPNPNDLLRPNMYAYATLTAERPGVLTLAASSLVTQGDVTQGYQTYCFLVENRQARRTLVRIGARGGDRVEVLKKQAKPAKAGDEGTWEDFTGDELVVQGNPGSLTDGQPVTIAPNP